MMNNREAFRNYLQNGARIGESMEKTFKAGYQAALASQAAELSSNPLQLDNHIGDCNEVVRSILENATKNHIPDGGEMVQSQAQQTENKWISVDEAKSTLKDGDLLYVAFQNGDVSEAVYRWEQGYYPHRITSEKYGNERLEICTHVMHRKPAPLPPAPEGGDK